MTTEGNNDLREYQLSIAIDYPKSQWLTTVTTYLTHAFVGQ